MHVTVRARLSRALLHLGVVVSAALLPTVATAQAPPAGSGVALLTPLSGASFGAPATVQITARAVNTDGTNMGRVLFYAGTRLIGWDDNAPYEYTWSNVRAGTHVLIASSRNASGVYVNSAPVSISVGTTPSPNQLPTVALSSPQAGAAFSSPATITVAATAADSDGTVARVEFYRGTTLIGTDTTSPYSAVWSNVAAGSYGLTAVAIDNAGGSTTSAPVAVTVGAPANRPPTVALTSPAVGATFTAPASIGIAANASDPDGTVAEVRFYNGATLLGSDTTAPFSFAWTNVAAGSYSLTAVARDQAGLTATSTAVTVTVGTPVNRPPTVSLTQPAGGTSYGAPATLSLAATASDPDNNLQQVSFYTGATLLGTDTSAPFAFSWSGVPAGSYTLTAVARDQGGLTATSAAVTVTVTAPPTSSSGVSLTSPQGGASFGAPATVTMTATAVNHDGTHMGRVLFYAGTALIGWDDDAPYGFTWSNVAAGTHALRASARNASGVYVTSAPVSITVGGSSGPNQPPTAAISSPQSGATFSSPATVTVTAGASDADGTVARVDFYRGSTLIGSDSSSPYSATWSGVSPGTYTLTAVATDNAGATMTSAPVSVTVTSNQSPSVSLTSPAADATVTAPASLTLAAAASDPDGTIARVDFYDGSTRVASIASSPYTFAWTNIAVGQHTLTAVAVDNSGATTVSGQRVLTVRDPALPQSAVWTPSANHDTAVDRYVVEIFGAGADPSTSNPVESRDVGKPSVIGGECRADIASTVSSLAPGTYFATVTAIGPDGSTRSAPSVPFTR